MKPKTDENLSQQDGPICSDAEVDLHLTAFINSFVFPDSRERWLEYFVQKRTKWKPRPRSSDCAKLYHKADGLLNSFQPIGPPSRLVKQEELLKGWAESFGDRKGLVFNTSSEPVRLTVSVAFGQFLMSNSSTIVSLSPGKLAVFFQHDGFVYLCTKSKL